MYSTKPIIDEKGNVTKERVASNEIVKIISQKVKEQKHGHTWWDEEVELMDGRRVKIRSVTRDGVFEE